MSSVAAVDARDRTGGEPDGLRLGRSGALHLPGILDPDLVMDLARQVREAIAELRWSVGRDDAAEVAGRQEGSEGWWAGYARVQALEAFHALPHHPRLVEVQRALVDAPFVHARRIANLLYPNFAVPPHQDYPAVQGTVDVCTLWVPLATLPPEAGVLRVLRRPELAGMLPLRPLPNAGAAIATDLGDAEWDAYPYRIGDVVVLHSLAVHEVTVNRSRELALSCDYRFQSRNEPVCDASLEPHHYPRVPGFRALTRGWSSRRWVRQPWLARRRRFLMPASIETWHEVLPIPPSRLADWRTPA